MRVTAHLKRPTREPCGPHVTGEPVCSPIWSCSGWGFPCRGRLPVARCALTAPFHPYLCPKAIGGVFSVALSVGSRPPGVTWHPVLWSPDFPPRSRAAAAWPTPVNMIANPVDLRLGAELHHDVELGTIRMSPLSGASQNFQYNQDRLRSQPVASPFLPLHA